jgi:hypothetical protein
LFQFHFVSAPLQLFAKIVGVAIPMIIEQVDSDIEQPAKTTQVQFPSDLALNKDRYAAPLPV